MNVNDDIGIEHIIYAKVYVSKIPKDDLDVRRTTKAT